MIAFRDVDEQVLARLDAVGTDAYDLNLDRIPAVNAAQHAVQHALTAMLEERKFSAENLRDLNVVPVYQTSLYGQVELSAPSSNGATLPFDVWSVVAVYPEFIAAGPMTPVPDTVDTRSWLRPDIRFTAPLKAAKRYTQEQWAAVNKDIFAPGNTIATNPKGKEYGYLWANRALVAGGPPSRPVLTVLGLQQGARHQVAVALLKPPNMVPQMPLYEADPLYASTQLEWPDNMRDLLVASALRALSYKQGDGTTQYTLSTSELSMLMGLIS